ncbi:MAG: hypothetical protein JWM20_822 [Patescibacteria group bacterium]|nr:hypothetical protein [Patescibacteria group bacterium]
MKSFIKNSWNPIARFFKSPEGIVFSAVLVAHCIAIIFLNNNPIQLTFAGDQLTYHRYGTIMADMIRHGNFAFRSVYASHWYPVFVGGIYAIFGPSMLIGSLANALLASIAAVLFLKILKGFGVSNKVSVVGSLAVFILYPSFLFHTSILLKEAWLVLLTLGILYASQKLVRGEGNRFLVFSGAFVLFLGLYDLRFFIGIAAMVALLADWFFNARASVKKRFAYGIPMLIIIVASTLLLLKWDVGENNTINNYVSPESVYTTRAVYGRNGGSTVQSPIFTQTFQNVPAEVQGTPEGKPAEAKGSKMPSYSLSIRGTAAAFANAILGPFPGQLPRIKYLTELPDVLFIYAVIIGALALFLTRSWKAFRTMVPVIICAGVVFATIAIGSDNLGAIVRQRITAVVVCSIIALFAVDLLIKTYSKNTRPT